MSAIHDTIVGILIPDSALAREATSRHRLRYYEKDR
jgi:hypothetical protein